MTDYLAFSQIIEYQFKNFKLLKEALTHPSALGNSNLLLTQSYERLEFLGDAVLSFIVSEFLIKNFPSETEGSLTKRRAALVNKEILVLIGKRIKILDYLIMSGIKKFSESETLKAIEDSTEALLGAIYLDGGMMNCRKFIMRYWKSFLLKKIVLHDDPKTYLQEWSQKKGFGIPEYVVISKSGGDHAPIFKVQVKVADLPKFIATGSSKKLAQKDAAKELIKHIRLNISK